MSTLKLKPLLTESEIQFLTSKYNRSSRRLLERKLNKVHNEIDRGAVKYTATLKNTLSEDRWNNLCNFVRPIIGISEAGAMSDADVAKAIAQVTKELTKGKMDVKPQDLDIDALDDPNAEPDELVKEVRVALKEGAVLATILAAPSIVKLIGNVADWVGSFLTKDASPEKRAITSLTNKLYKYAKKNKDKKTKKHIIPAKSDIVNALKLDEKEAKYVDAVFERIAKFTRVDNKKQRKKQYAWILNQDEFKNAPISKKKQVIQYIKDNPDIQKDKAGMRKLKKFTGLDIFDTSGKEFHAAHFDAEGKEQQLVDGHILHIMYEATFDTTIGKSIGKAAHQLHELFLVPFKHVVAASMWLSSKAKIGVKKGWNWLKGKLGMDSKEVTDVGLTYEQAYDKSSKIANTLYTVVMIVVALNGLLTHGINGAEAKEKLVDVLKNAKDSQVVIDIFNAIKSSVESVLISMEDGIKAGDLLGELGAIISEFWDEVKPYLAKFF